MMHLFNHRSVINKYRTMCSKAAAASSSSLLRTAAATNESNAKVIYSVAQSMGHNEVGHIECSARVVTILRALEQAKLSPKFRESEVIQLQNCRSATLDDVARVHSISYISSLQKAMEDTNASENGVLRIEGSGPSYVTATTFQDSLDAAGAGLSVVDSVVAASKISDDPPVGFAMIRPPGHHAVPTAPMGFCFFGNVAIAARYAQRVHGLKRVFIIDFDVHHGNGTNDAFYDDPDIFFLSTHQDGDFPRGTGKFDDIGCGNGEGATLNLPLPERTGEIGMRTVFDEVIVPAAQRFKPDIILVSAGYDGHVLDPVGNFQLEARTYHSLALNIKQLAKDLCGGRCVFFMEGGYKLGTLAFSVAETFRAFIGEPSMATEFDKKYAFFLQDEPTCKINEAIQKIKRLHSL